MAPQNPDPTLFDPEYSLAAQDGPYGILYPSTWYRERNPGLLGYNETPIGFQPEVGSVSSPKVTLLFQIIFIFSLSLNDLYFQLESLKRFLSPESLKNFPQKMSSDSSTVSHSWDYHKYISFTTKDDISGAYDHIYAYGDPVDALEYSVRAQLVQYEQYRALFEGYRLHQWEYYSAVLMWKSQSPWPTLRGALYDYYLDQTGGFFGVRKALGYTTLSANYAGLHAQLDPSTLQVTARVKFTLDNRLNVSI
jgi:mannosylglycoprotein endo-beta-mannosidase